jgi:hypothetical protein
LQLYKTTVNLTHPKPGLIFTDYEEQGENQNFLYFLLFVVNKDSKFKGYVNVGPEICDPGCLKYPDSHQKYVAIDCHRYKTVWQF